MSDSGALSNAAEQQQVVDGVVDRLEAGIARAVDHDTLQAVVEKDFHRYDAARIRDFIPVLVENDIRARILTSRAS